MENIIVYEEKNKHLYQFFHLDNLSKSHFYKIDVHFI
jgi:hypothetical protein